ncbi:hypothetical protein BH09BAC4_BH09BAC4_39060 [soil metagenome]
MFFYHKVICNNRMFNYLIVLVFILGIDYAAYGQASLSDSSAFSAKISIGGSLNDGNFQRIGLTNNADFALNTRNRRFGLQSHTQYNFTKTFGTVSENDLLTRTLFYSKLEKRWYAIFIFWYETNKLRQMHPLVQAGPSLEYVWLLQKDNMGGLSLGATYEHKRFNGSFFNESKYDGSRSININRLFARLHGKNKIGISNVAFIYDIFYMPSLQYNDNYRVHAEASFGVPISKHLNLRAGMNYNYESVVIAGVKPNDFFTDYGISINF